MDVKELARRTGTVANMLVTASLFFVLVWWKVSAWLFVAGCVVFGVAWLMDGSELPSPFTVRE